ncbi:hypothetical protein ACFQS8_15120 [Hirschia litorea]|uniref:Uncharacterized protein n=1 Tax=Hirschia litorea TaxID=1199156 RepID=A0ABW2IPQ9_9PROT
MIVVERLENYSNTHWSKPLFWHAGAIAQATRVQSLKSQWFPELSDDANRLGNIYAERTVRVNPTHGTSWYRLADYFQMGYENDVCEGRACLENSWKIEPMTRDFNMACGRFKLAGLYGSKISPESEKVKNYIASYYYQDYFKNSAYHQNIYRQKTAACFDFLAPKELFLVLQSIK